MSTHAPAPTVPELHGHHMPIGRGPLLAAAALVLATLLGVGVVRGLGVDVSSRSQAPVIKQRALLFEDQADGSVRVLQPVAGQPPLLVQQVAPGAGGFLRGAMRALVRHRRLAGLGAEMPFTLSAHADGRLTLDDPATGHRVYLESFGPANSVLFAQLLSASPTPAPAAR